MSALALQNVDLASFAHAGQGVPLHQLSACAMREGFAQQRFTPLQVWQSLHAAIADDVFNAFTAIDVEGAAAQAAAATQRWQQGAPLSALDGVPVSIKDLVPVQGMPTRRGCALSPAAPSAADAPVVQHLRAAGAVLFAKTTTTEMGCAIHGDSPAHGRTLHPLDAARSVGGSSCGAAAQLAAGWGPLAVGSDAGGSVRIPASYAGLVAFKPTFGCIPMWPPSPFVEFAHLGPMARTVQDVALLLQVIGQPHAQDPASGYPRSAGVGGMDASGADCSSTLSLRQRPLRVGICTHMGAVHALQSDIAHSLQGLGAWLQGRMWQGQSLDVVPIDLSHVDTGEAMWTVWCSRVLEVAADLSAAQRQLLGADLQRQYTQGMAHSAGALAQARKTLREAAMQLAPVFENIDVLLTPATPSTAPAVGDFVSDHDARADALRSTGNWMAATPFSHPWNLMQQPALALPWGHDAQGLPWGLQVVGSRYSDGFVLAFGAALQTWRSEDAA